MDDPKHIGLHDGEFEQKKKKNLYFVFCLVHHSHRDMEKKKMVRRFTVAEKCLTRHIDIAQWC